MAAQRDIDDLCEALDLLCEYDIVLGYTHDEDGQFIVKISGSYANDGEPFTKLLDATAVARRVDAALVLLQAGYGIVL